MRKSFSTDLNQLQAFGNLGDNETKTRRKVAKSTQDGSRRASGPTWVSCAWTTARDTSMHGRNGRHGPRQALIDGVVRNDHRRRQLRVGHGLDASTDWIGLRRMDDVILCYRWSKQVCLDY